MTAEQAVEEFRDYLDGRQEKISDEVMDMAVEELKAQRMLKISGYQDEIDALREELAKSRTKSADDVLDFVPDLGCEEYADQRLKNYNGMLKSGILDCVKEEGCE